MNLTLIASLLFFFTAAHADIDAKKCNEVLDQIEIPINPSFGKWATVLPINEKSEFKAFRDAHARESKSPENLAIEAENQEMNRIFKESGGLQPGSRAYTAAKKQSEAKAEEVRKNWEDADKREAMVQKSLLNNTVFSPGEDADGTLKLGEFIHISPKGYVDQDLYRKAVESNSLFESSNYSLGPNMSAFLRPKDREKKAEYMIKSIKDEKGIRFSFSRMRKNQQPSPEIHIDFDLSGRTCKLKSITTEYTANVGAHDTNTSIGVRRQFFSQENCSKAQSLLQAKEFHGATAKQLVASPQTQLFYCPGNNSPLNFCKEASESKPIDRDSGMLKLEVTNYYAENCQPFEKFIEAPSPAIKGSFINRLFKSEGAQ